MPIQCRQCGTESEETSRFCANCGHSLLPEHADSASQENAASGSATPEAGAHAAADNTGTVRSNPFSEFYSPQTESSGLHRALLIISAAVAIVGAAAGAAYYFGHRKYEIAELAKLHALAPPAAGVKQDNIFPCPSTAPFCIGTAASKIKDPACDSDKPVWAHYTEDGGTTWKRAGCYATEAEARQGLSETLGVVGTATSKTTKQARKPAEARTEKAASKPSQQHPAPTTGEGTASKSYHASFKGPFGITVEKRTYSSEQMKEKALDLWEREKKILEPDGSINDKYVLKPKPASGLIPGH